MTKDIKTLEKIVSIHRTDRDYTRDYFAAKDLVRRIQSYWHNKGYTKVKIWIEPMELSSGDKRWDIRGNIVFNCDSIQKDLLS